MDENQAAQEATVTEETAPEVGASDWEDEPLLPDEDESPEGDADADALSGEADAPSGEDARPEETETPSGDGKGAQPGDGKPSEPEAPKEPEPDYKALYEARREQDNAAKYRAVYNEQLVMTGSEAVARLIARNECGGKDYPLEDAPASGDAGTPSAPGQPDFRAALAEIQSLYPDATEMPASVMRDFADGKSLPASYAAYRAKADAETIATLRRENAALKKAESNRKSAPVKGVSGDRPENNDPFLQGFDADD